MKSVPIIIDGSIGSWWWVGTHPNPPLGGDPDATTIFKGQFLSVPSVVVSVPADAFPVLVRVRGPNESSEEWIDV